MSDEEDTQIEFEFDKFMDDTLIKENRALTRDPKDEELTPQRKHDRARRERVGHLIRYTGGEKK